MIYIISSCDGSGTVASYVEHYKLSRLHRAVDLGPVLVLEEVGVPLHISLPIEVFESGVEVKGIVSIMESDADPHRPAIVAREFDGVASAAVDHFLDGVLEVVRDCGICVLAAVEVDEFEDAGLADRRDLYVSCR